MLRFTERIILSALQVLCLLIQSLKALYVVATIVIPTLDLILDKVLKNEIQIAMEDKTRKSINQVPCKSGLGGGLKRKEKPQAERARMWDHDAW